ncbi:hypothetical protein [Pseudonocardia sp. WMMC193]|uniref:hypothetical protein n=1 Tax=Pseudonocardia sp. WMMC193 TaxID=2911965 RepID=UPI001F3E8658|nr:hypothetical protein [Pseudonocardia sp. WMMC193]MCF7548900.1 hypothetical protein [Pseudonocardia sp. WMMC193]
MAMFKAQVTQDGKDPYTVEIGARDVAAWERKGRDRAFSDFMARPRVTDMFELAYLSSRRQGLFAGTEQEFLELVDVEGATDEAEGPTQPAP